MASVPLPTVCTANPPTSAPCRVCHPGSPAFLLKFWLLQWGLQSNLISKSLEQWGPTGLPARHGMPLPVLCAYSQRSHEPLSHPREWVPGWYPDVHKDRLPHTCTVNLGRKATGNRISWSNCKELQPSFLTMKSGPALHSDGPRITVICGEIQTLLVSLFASSFWNFLLWKFHMASAGQFPCTGWTWQCGRCLIGLSLLKTKVIVSGKINPDSSQPGLQLEGY